MSLDELTERILRRLAEMSDDEILSLFEQELGRVRDQRGGGHAEPPKPEAPPKPRRRPPR